MILKDNSVLLINPWIYDFAAFDLWSRPLGLLYIASILEKSSLKVDFIDCLDRFHPESQAPLRKGKLHTSGPFYREIVETPQAFISPPPRPYARYGMPLEIFKNELLKITKPKAILIHSIMTYWYLGAYKAAELVKQLWPDVPIFLGGIYASLCTSHALKNPYGMHVAAGPFEEIEASFWQDKLDSELVDCFSQAYKKSIFDYKAAWHLYKKNPVRAILTVRGCPKNCPYCASRSLYNNLLLRDLDDVLAEIEEALALYKSQEIVFYDDALTIGPENRFDIFLESLVKLKEKYPWQSLRLPNGIFVKAITKERAQLMKKAGFSTIRLGLETVNLKRQKELGAKVEEGDFERAAKFLTDAGFTKKELGAYILTGLPGKLNYKDLYQSAKTAKTLGFKACLAEYAPTPKTLMWQTAILESNFNIEEEPLLHNNCYHPLRAEGFSFKKYWNLKNKIHER